jgi:(1->4)-alpha-D-glucan 1-alpha-D-glucosylmutase
LNSDFTFSEARNILGYLSDLGITDIYTSSYLKARSGSLHGYDIVDFQRLNDEIGSPEEFDSFVDEQKRQGLGQLFDLVPNHMCIASSENVWWMDVLENGPSSIYARFFDINWNPVKRELKNKILVPILGDQYGRVLENQELKLSMEEGSFLLSYWDHRFPIRPDSYIQILSYRIKELESVLSADNEHYIELLSINTALTHLPLYTETDPDKMAERNREKEIVKRRLHVLYNESPGVREFIDTNISMFNGVKGDPPSFDLLDQLLQGQAFRLSYWRVATEEKNYRRFFDINDLAAIRMEDPFVFAETHKLPLRLVGEGTVTGLRIDHPDGLYDPSQYFNRLQRKCYIERGLEGERLTGQEGEDGRAAAADRLGRDYDEMIFSDRHAKPFYIIGEKILMRNEEMPDEWPIYSTTGYSFCNLVGGLFVDPSNAAAFTRIYKRFTRSTENYQQVIYDKKKFIMQTAMSSEINTLANYLNRISEKNRHTRDFTFNSLTAAIVEVIAFFPVYRTYINNWNIVERDRKYIEFAVTRAKRANTNVNPSLFAFLADVLLLQCPPDFNDEDRSQWLDFVMRFQQITGPVMAKGLEDTSFYVYNRLICLNEVGGSPDQFGTTAKEFHEHNMNRLKNWPCALVTTSTHDSKRSEDVRARISVLSEIPEEWRKRVAGWSQLNKKRRLPLNGRRVPDANDEYFLYQTLAGAWPLNAENESEYGSFVQRMKDYMLKAIREAKVNTSWIIPHPDYEEQSVAFVERILTRKTGREFLEDFELFEKKIAYCGMCNSLSQTLLKIMSPGVPDFYQGTELWNFSLVDPDNRRPVDYERRTALLEDFKRLEKEVPAEQVAADVFAHWDDGRIKMYVTYKALALRKRYASVLREADYVALEPAGGPAGGHVVGFARQYGSHVFVVAVPRFLTGLLDGGQRVAIKAEAWKGSYLRIPSHLPPSYEDVFTGRKARTEEYQHNEALHCADLFDAFPVALLYGSNDGPNE